MAKVTKEEELEHGLARARASIRRAASARSFTLNTTGHQLDDVVSAMVYRNPAAFHQ